MPDTVSPLAGHEDPERIVGPERCGECHTAEFEAWKTSSHQQGYRTMHKSELARGIVEKLGGRSVKRTAQCVECHYTVSEKRGRHRARHGVSCESCHGAAKDWVSTHASYGDAEATRETETAEHRAARITACDDAGMRRPGALVDLAESCYRCHVLRDERLVEAGHPVPGEFELVTWSQGEMRHNYLASGGTENAESPQHRRRLMLIVGAVLDVQYSLLALAEATTDGDYFAASRKHHVAARRRFDDLADRLGKDADIGAIVDLVRSAKMEPGRGDALRAAAGDIARHLREFCARRDGSDLGALDAALPDATAYRGAPRR